MRPQKVNDIELLEGLMQVLQSRGYDGASLNELAASSGLQKASLYHRFPEGKKEIALAVLDYVHNWIEKNIYNLLIDQSLHPDKRLNKVLKNIDDLYGKGTKTCILRALLIDSNEDFLGKKIQVSMNRWKDGFIVLGIDLGFSKKEATKKSIQTLINVQGSLVVSKGLYDLQIFKSSLKAIREMYHIK